MNNPGGTSVPVCKMFPVLMSKQEITFANSLVCSRAAVGIAIRRTEVKDNGKFIKLNKYCQVKAQL